MQESEKISNSSKSNHSNNYIKHEWVKHPTQQAEIVSLDKKESSDYMLSTRNIS